MTADMIEVMKEAARAAGDYMCGSDERAQTNKSNAKDFVTVADVKSQNILREMLRTQYPIRLYYPKKTASRNDDSSSHQTSPALCSIR